MRTLFKTVTVAAPVAEVWTGWTTEEGVASFAAPEATIDLRLGGAYEWYFMLDALPGDRGAEGCTVLAYVPPRLLAFTWNAPPSIPALRALGPCSHVVVELDDLGDGGRACASPTSSRARASTGTPTSRTSTGPGGW